MIVRTILAFLAAVVATYVAAAASSTQFVLAELTALGIDVPLGERVATTIADVGGMVGIYAPVIAGGFLIAFLVAAAVIRWLLPGWDRLGYPLAGFVAMAAALGLMIEIFEIVPIAGARSSAGFLCQALAGALGGWIFVRIREGGTAP